MAKSGLIRQIVGGHAESGRGMGLGPSAGRGDDVQSMRSMPAIRQIILIHRDALPKPVTGAPCNGCGVCCLLEPCPLGVILSVRRRGACAAVRWHDELHQYRCGALCDPLDVLRHVLPQPLRLLAPWLSPGLVGLAKRWIAAGEGCDSSVEMTAPPLAAPAISPTIHRNVPSRHS